MVMQFILQGTVDNNLGPDRLARSQLLQTTNSSIARPLSGSPNSA